MKKNEVSKAELPVRDVTEAEVVENLASAGSGSFKDILHRMKRLYKARIGAKSLGMALSQLKRSNRAIEFREVFYLLDSCAVVPAKAVLSDRGVLFAKFDNDEAVETEAILLRGLLPLLPNDQFIGKLCFDAEAKQYMIFPSTLIQSAPFPCIAKYSSGAVTVFEKGLVLTPSSSTSDTADGYYHGLLTRIGMKQFQFTPTKQICSLDEPSALSQVALAKYDLAHPILEDVAVSKAEIAYQDLTLLPFVTIDGLSTRDIDDAIYVESVDETTMHLYVAIADVSAYIEPDSELDQVVRCRATSLYLPHFTRHMLPESLAASHCSLNPNEVKDTLTVKTVLRLVEGAWALVSADAFRAKIKSVARLDYDQVDRWDNQETELASEVSKSLSLLKQYTLHNTHQIRDDDEPELEYNLDENGKVSSLFYKSYRTLSHKMVESAMLLANKAVSEIFTEKSIAAPFRNQLKPLGWDSLTDEEKEADRKRVKPAFYGSANHGHFSLNAPSYVHFTSPIRRYADLLCHRLLLGEVVTDLPMALIQINAINAKAKLAEQKATRWLTTEYAEQFIGEVFTATVKDWIDDNGVVLELPNLISGYVPISSMTPEQKQLIQEFKSKQTAPALLFKVKIKEVSVPNEKVKLEVVSVSMA